MNCDVATIRPDDPFDVSQLRKCAPCQQGTIATKPDILHRQEGGRTFDARVPVDTRDGFVFAELQVGERLILLRKKVQKPGVNSISMVTQCRPHSPEHAAS